MLQTYIDTGSWKESDTLIPDKLIDKESAHAQDLLHLSAHLLIVNSKREILSRKRKADDFRYAGMWTSSIGTHVLDTDDYESTLRPLLPINREMRKIGEFRVHDEFENEVNGLFVIEAKEEDLPDEFMADKKFFNREELQQIISRNETTPHLKAAYELLEERSFW